MKVWFFMLIGCVAGLAAGAARDDLVTVAFTAFGVGTVTMQLVHTGTERRAEIRRLQSATGRRKR